MISELRSMKYTQYPFPTSIRSSKTLSPTDFESPKFPCSSYSILRTMVTLARLSFNFLSHFENCLVCKTSFPLDRSARARPPPPSTSPGWRTSETRPLLAELERLHSSDQRQHSNLDCCPGWKDCGLRAGQSRKRRHPAACNEQGLQEKGHREEPHSRPCKHVLFKAAQADQCR